MNSTKVLHRNINSTKVLHTNCTKVVHTNSTKVVHTNTDSTKVVHMNSTKVLHMNSVHGKVVTHSRVTTNSTCVSGAPCSCLNSTRLEQQLLLFTVGSSSDSWKDRTATSTIL